jgi:hypothetical protein
VSFLPIRRNQLSFLCLATLAACLLPLIQADALTLTRDDSAMSIDTPGSSVSPLAASEGSLPDAPSQQRVPLDQAGESSSRTQAKGSGLKGSDALDEVNQRSTKVQWKPTLIQTAEFTVFQHAWRAAWDPGLRYLLAHKPFWHDYGVSLTDYHMEHWSDGDSFVVNDVGHPLEGAAYGRILLQNYPKSYAQIGLQNGYWKTRLQSLAWMTLWSTQFEIGPLSETTIGNQGGFYYSNGCGTSKACLTTPPWSAGANRSTGLGGVTNNTGWTDFIITPIVGLGWIIGEDTIDRFFVTPIARDHRIFGGRILRSALEPSRSFAALFAGKYPWMLPAPENNFAVHQRPKVVKIKDPNEKPLQHYELGTQYTNVSLPILKEGCAAHYGCRESLSGAGFNFNYNFNRAFSFDSAVNFLPGQAGTQGMMQGLFGVKLGERWNRWGLFAKVRPGFVYYNQAWSGGASPTTTSLSRFVWDFGGVAEVYTRHHGTFRVDLGTTLVRYLSDRTDTRMTEIGGVISNQYYNNQGNLQFSTGYVYRF